MLQDSIKDRDLQIEQLKKAYNDLEDETNGLIRNFRGQILAKETEFSHLQDNLVKQDDEQLSKKMSKIADLERKITNLKVKHDEEITYLKDQIENYQNMLREKDMENESRLLDFSSKFRKRETETKSEQFKLKKDMQVLPLFLNNLASNRDVGERPGETE